MAYFFIPKQHESTIKPFVDSWNATGRQTIVTGEHKDVPYTVTNENTSIKAKLINGKFLTIAKTIHRDDSNIDRIINKEIIGFTVEGNLEEQLPPEVYSQLMSLDGIHREYNSTAYLVYINNLKEQEQGINLIIE